MKRTTLVLAAVAIFAMTGCSNKKLIAQKDAEIADLQGDVDALQAEVAEQKRLNGDLDRELADLQEEKRVWLVEKDNLVHITLDGAATFATASADLTADGKDFKLADLEQKTFFYGPATACNLARFTQVPVPGHALVSLLRGEAPVLLHKDGAGKAEIKWDGSHYKIVINSTQQAEEEIHLGVHPDDFEKPWKATNQVRFTFQPAGDRVSVTWGMDGNNDFLGKAFSLFMDMDKMLGGEFEKGLTSLKQVSEADAAKRSAEAKQAEAQAAAPAADPAPVPSE